MSPKTRTPMSDEHKTAVAASYGERMGITYSAWRELSVPSPVLTQAGISRSS